MFRETRVLLSFRKNHPICRAAFLLRLQSAAMRLCRDLLETKITAFSNICVLTGYLVFRVPNNGTDAASAPLLSAYRFRFSYSSATSFKM